VAGQIWRFILLQYPAGRVAAGVPLRIVDLDLVPVRNAFLFAIPFALAFIAGGAWILSTRALRPVRELIRQIQGITAEGLDHRLDEEGTDSEFAALTVVFNAMLERLERGFHQASRFAADAAHELKTPLAILQGQIERAIAQAGAGSEQQAALTGMLDEVRRLSGLSRKLVLLAQADAGRLRIRPEPVDLSAFLADLAEDARLLAPGMAVSERIPPGLYVEADPDLLRQILHNLISNAVKYNLREQGWIELVAGQNGSDGDGDGGSGGHGGASGHGGAGYIEVAVINAAAPMDPVARGHLFDRFYRGDRSRSRNIEGTGLGLTLAREIARAHGGDLVIADSPPGSVRMVLRLPAPAGAAPAPGPGSATPAARASAPASR
jgi:signal transduction histidine kinase